MFFKMFVKKVFQLVKPFLANLLSTICKKYSYCICTLWPQNLFISFFTYDNKKTQNYAEKVYLKKVICQKFLQVSSMEEHKLQFCTLLLPITFLLAFFCIFLNSFEISVKFWVVLIPILKFCEKFFLKLILALFRNFKALFAKNGSKF